MSDLQNLTPANTYKALLQLDAGYTNGISGSTGANALQVSDGAGNNTSLALSTDRVGIGTTSPSAKLTLPLSESIHFNDSSGVTKAEINSGLAGTLQIQGDFDLRFKTTNEAMRIDSAGNVGIGTTSPTAKLFVKGNQTDEASISISADNSVGEKDASIFLNATRGTGNSGSNAEIRATHDGGSGLGMLLFGTRRSPTEGITNALAIDSAGNVLPGTDDAQDFGSSSKRWDDIYATNTTIQSSDRELKQHIEELSEAETRVAQACKGLLRKYRWKNAVAQKGDEARIHFGIIAQDLEDAFTAEGLDAGRYGMFVKNTWWTADRVIPAVEAVEAVEAVYDEEGNELSPAVEAVEAQPERTVTDIFNNSEDAPERATEVTQRGVRYSELLAFIISAI